MSVILLVSAVSVLHCCQRASSRAEDVVTTPAPSTSLALTPSLLRCRATSARTYL
jgi:hypothetical protein